MNNKLSIVLIILGLTNFVLANYLLAKANELSYMVDKTMELAIFHDGYTNCTFGSVQLPPLGNQWEHGFLPNGVEYDCWK